MTEYSRRPVGVDPGISINLAFASATLDVAQHPSLGVAKVGAQVVRNVLDGVMTPEEAAWFRPTQQQLRAQVGVAAASHVLVGVYGIPRKSLDRSVPFAYDLVLNGLVQSGAEHERGFSRQVLPEIGVPTEDEYDAYERLLANPRKARRFGSMLGKMAARLANPMGPAQQVIDEYHATITDVSAHYREDHDNPERMQELARARDGLAAGVRGHLLDALTLFERKTGGEVLVDNVLRHHPSRELVSGHFG